VVWDPFAPLDQRDRSSSASPMVGEGASAGSRTKLVATAALGVTGAGDSHGGTMPGLRPPGCTGCASHGGTIPGFFGLSDAVIM
jgi:hypothetical protein